MNTDVHVNGSSIGFAGALTLVFITLKLVGIIDWPWIWVLSPIWISLVLVILVLIVVFVFYFIANLRS